MDNGHTQDPAHGLLEDLGHLGRIGATSLKPQQRRDGLEVVLDPMVDLLNHRAFDAQLLLLAVLVGDVLDDDDGTRRLAGAAGQATQPATRLGGQERDGLLDPDAVLLGDALLQAGRGLDRAEGNVLVCVQLRKLSVDQTVGVAEQTIETLGNGRHVFDLAARVDHHHPVVHAESADVLATIQAALNDQVADPGHRPSEEGTAPALALVLDDRRLDGKGGDDALVGIMDGKDLAHDRHAANHRALDLVAWLVLKQ